MMPYGGFDSFSNAVQCPVGTYFSLEHHECESCWLGSYQDQEGQLECKSCPEGTSTAYLHSRSIAECKGRKPRSGPPLFVPRISYAETAVT